MKRQWWSQVWKPGLTAQPFPDTPTLHCLSPQPQFCRRPSLFHFQGLSLAGWGGGDTHWERCMYHFGFLPWFETRAWKQDSQCQVTAKAPEKRVQWQARGEWAMACDSEDVREGWRARLVAAQRRYMVVGMQWNPPAWCPCAITDSVPAQLYSWKQRMVLCVLNYNATYREFISSKLDAWCIS